LGNAKLTLLFDSFVGLPCDATAGLIVLRVAEVAQFQEKILRAILNGDITDVIITPQQM